MRSERGFTLIEVMVAFVIAALALTVLFRGIGTGLAAVRTAGMYEEAVSRAKSHLALLGRDAGLTAGDFNGDDGRGYHWHLTVALVATSKAKAQDTQGFALPAAPAVGLYAVTVTLSWTEHGKQRDVTLRTSRLGRPGTGNG